MQDKLSTLKLCKFVLIHPGSNVSLSKKHQWNVYSVPQEQQVIFNPNHCTKKLAANGQLCLMQFWPNGRCSSFTRDRRMGTLRHTSPSVPKSALRTSFDASLLKLRFHQTERKMVHFVIVPVYIKKKRCIFPQHIEGERERERDRAKEEKERERELISYR